MRFYSPAPIFDVEEILAQAMADPKNIMHIQTVRKKKSCTRKLPNPRQKNNVANMQRFPLRLRCELTNQVNEFSIKAPLTDFLKSIKFRISRDEYFA